MSKLSYEEFIVRLLERIEDFDINDFKNLIVKIAIEKNGSDRQSYLDFIDEILLEEGKTYKNVKNELKIREEEGDSDLIEDITELYDKVKEGYYEGNWEWDPEYHEERMSGDDSWAEDAAELFLRTENVFRKGEYEISLKAYEMLFDILSNEELSAYDDYESMMEIDLDKQKNLFLICIYYANDTEKRPMEILNTINKMGYKYRSNFRLTNIIDYCPEELPEFHEFIKLFITTLININEMFYKELLIDTVFIDGGIDGVKEFARKNHEIYPEAYLFFITKFEKEEIDNDKIIAVCEEALLKISRDHKIRDSIAKIMINAAINENKSGIVMEGIREAFYSNPQIENIVLMFEYGRKYKCNENENILFATERLMNLLETNLSKENVRYFESISISAKKTLHKLYLLSGQLVQAFKMTLKEENKGAYEGNIDEFTKVFLLILLSRDNNKYSYTINRLWNENVDSLRLERKIKEKFLAMIFENIKKTTVAESDIEKYMDWCTKKTLNVINEIVSNQYRGLYDKAAEALIACAEMIANVRGEEKAYEMINRITAIYPRHTSFKKSVNKVLKEAKIEQK
jgi:hypothetical protein